jgi:YVTN family beta-propeller protein
VGNQFSLWGASKHARAYASLWSPEAKKIAELSGIPQEPQEAPACLGCHAAAFDAEPWEKEDTFFIEDGVQCESCHGPGSEYIGPEIMNEMMDPEKAKRYGLRLPKEEEGCLSCHKVKGSHEAVLGPQEYEVHKAQKKIAHPIPERPETATQPESEPAASARPETPAEAEPVANIPGVPQYTGVMACARCHKGPGMGYQFSLWRLSEHARAFVILGTPEGRELAVEEGVTGNPQEDPQCLRCHTTGAGREPSSFLPGFSITDGVQCESCHGMGSEYSAEVVMRDPAAARASGLLPVTEETCAPCHDRAHGRDFDYESAVLEIAHPTEYVNPEEKPRYKTPLNLAFSPDGAELYVACEASDSVIVVDVDSHKAIAEIAVGGQATDVAFSPDGRRAYVTNRLDDTVSVIDVAARSVVATVPVGDEPHGVLTDEAGRRLYVLNTTEDSISVLEAGTMEETKRLAASRRPWSLALSPDGKHLAVTNALSRFVPFRAPPVSEVTIIDATVGRIENRAVVPGANMMQGISWEPGGRFALATLNRTKNLVPMTRLLQGWTVTNGLAVIWADGRVDQVLLDEPHLCFPDPTDVAVSPDGRYALVSSSGSDRVAVLDVPKMISMLQNASDYERQHVFPNHLGKPTEFILKHIPTESGPRGVAISKDGRTAFVANSFADSLTVIDMNRLEAVGRIDLGGPKEITKARYGERLFHSADITFHRQFSCHTCHPDGHVDGLTYDIEPDGIGVAPVDNRTLRGILDTAPFKWVGTNPTLTRQCGPRLAVFFTRIDPFTPAELSALVRYIATIPRPPNRYRPLGAPLTPTQRRGKAVFERIVTNDGRPIPVEKRCVTCHFPPLYTDRSRRDVGSKMEFDYASEFDVPHLNNIYDSAPYMHNGIADTLEEIWTRYNPYDTHGVTNDLTKDELNALIEYLKTL